MGIKELASNRTDEYHIDPRLLNIKPGWNGRDFEAAENAAHIEELALSIANIGVRKPLDVFMEDGKVFISDGECRYRATMLAIKRGADIKTVPIRNETRHTSEAERLLNQVVGNSGKTFTPLERASVFKRLIDFGWTEKEIADKSGVSSQHVRDMLQLLAAPAPVVKMIKAGKVSPTLALTTLKKSKGNAEKTLKKAVKSATKSGKKKATARDVTAKGKTFKQTMRDHVESMTLLQTLKNTDPVMPGMSAPPVEVTVKMPKTTWEALIKLL